MLRQVLVILFVVLKFGEIGAIRCYCLRSQFLDPCEPNSIYEICDERVKHCFMTISRNQTNKQLSATLLGCWKWGTTNCPTVPDTFGHDNGYEDHKNYCCHGSLCNNFSKFNISLSYGESIVSKNSTTTVNSTTSGAQRPLSLTQKILIPVSIVSLLVILTIILLIRHKLKGKSHGHEHDGNDSGENRSPSSNRTHDSEISEIASKCHKVILKAQGRFGSVWLVDFTQSPNSQPTPAAAKIFQSSQDQSWAQEVATYRLPGMQHTNILRFYGSDKVSITEVRTELWIVTEYHQLGSLYDYLQNNTLSWIDTVRIGLGVARGVNHLHEANLSESKPSIAHRDIKTKNVLLRADLTPCIADFGLSIHFDIYKTYQNEHVQAGTKRYMAPEVLEGAIQFSRNAFLRIDVYAMSLVIYELMARSRPDSIQLPLEPIPVSVTVPDYKAPFEVELGANPTLEELRNFVVTERMRPQPVDYWLYIKNISYLWQTVQEAWDQEAETRISAGCVMERLERLLSNISQPDDMMVSSNTSDLDLEIPLLSIITNGRRFPDRRPVDDSRV